MAKSQKINLKEVNFGDSIIIHHIDPELSEKVWSTFTKEPTHEIYYDAYNNLHVEMDEDEELVIEDGCLLSYEVIAQ